MDEELVDLLDILVHADWPYTYKLFVMLVFTNCIWVYKRLGRYLFKLVNNFGRGVHHASLQQLKPVLHIQRSESHTLGHGGESGQTYLRVYTREIQYNCVRSAPLSPHFFFLFFLSFFNNDIMVLTSALISKVRSSKWGSVSWVTDMHSTTVRRTCPCEIKKRFTYSRVAMSILGLIT